MVAAGGGFGKRAVADGGVTVLATQDAADAGAADTVECPFCAEQILARAKKCRHCNETVDVAMRKAEEAMRSVDRPAAVYMNAGGGMAGGGLGFQQLRPFNHGVHLIISLFSAGFWLPFWFILYLMRDRSVYF